MIEEMRRLPHQLELDNLPTMEELYMEELSLSLSRLRKGKAGGKTGVLPELLLYGSVELRIRLLQVMQDVWEVGAVVDDWKDAVIVPIPKLETLGSVITGRVSVCWMWCGRYLHVLPKRDSR